MIDHEKWTNTLNIRKKDIDNESNLDPNKWIETLPKPKTKNSIKKYSFTAVIFMLGLILVSVIKNETRGLQKEIFNLQTSINNIKLDLHKASLDHEVITSPENISKLAKKHLESEFFDTSIFEFMTLYVSTDLNLEFEDKIGVTHRLFLSNKDIYEKSQIKSINEKNKNISKIDKNKTNKQNKVKKLSKNVKLKIENEIETKKNELKKLQKIAKKPEKLPGEIKLHIVKKIEAKKKEIKNLYNNPKSIITPDRVQSWAGVQLVKAFLGIPIIPGK